MKKVLFTLLCLLSIGFTSKAQEKIIGGQHAGQVEFPFITALYDPTVTGFFNAQFCGGSLIAPNWVLTAGHCVHDNSGNVIPPSQIAAAFNVWVLSHPNAGFDSIAVSHIFVHPGYNDTTLDNDLALLQLYRHSTQTPIALVSQGDESLIAAGTNLHICGWGLTNFSASISADTLMKVDVQAISTSVCNGASSYAGQILPSMFCAGFMAGGKDACSGDSGGPIFGDVAGHPVQTGIVSWGNDCALPNFPGVYTKLSNYINWIRSVTGLNIGISTTENTAWFMKQADDKVMITAPNDAQTAIVQLLDASGRIINQQEIRGNQTMLLDRLANGIYFVTLQSTDANISRKIIKY
jgi:secreted trypsin-like serine protease